MLNFRKLRHDSSPNVLKEGKSIFDKGGVANVKVLKISSDSIRFLAKVVGQFDHTYTCELEVDRGESSAIDSDCDCSAKYDCQHQAALIFHLEDHIDDLIVHFSKDEKSVEVMDEADEEEKEKLQETFKEAETLSKHRKGKKQQKELIEEYAGASKILGSNPFFKPEEQLVQDNAEIAILFVDQKQIEVQLALRLPLRSKPLYVLNLKEFLEAVRFEEPLYMGGKRYFFKRESFDEDSYTLLEELMHHIRFIEQKPQDAKAERALRVGVLDPEAFGALLAKAFLIAQKNSHAIHTTEEGSFQVMPSLYFGEIETPLKYSTAYARLAFELEYLSSSAPKLMIKTSIRLADGQTVQIEDLHLFESSPPGLIHDHVYYRFQKEIKREHLRHLEEFQYLTVPEPLFGTFVENSLHEMMRFGEVCNKEAIEKFATIPFAHEIGAECDISYLEGEFDATLHFVYDKIKVPLATCNLVADEILSFVTPKGILARNLTEEQKIIDDLFQDFIFDAASGTFKAKTDKKIVEFMTEVIPKYKHRVKFNCPENLLNRFIFDDTHFKIHLEESKRVDVYQIQLKVNGPLKGLQLEQLWECLAQRRPYVELKSPKNLKKKGGHELPSKILVINLDKLAPVLQVFDEMGIVHLVDSNEERPLWSLASVEPSQFKGLPVDFSISKRLLEIQKQILGLVPFKAAEIPKEINATLRHYQAEGVHWLERLRKMHLNGILADDMGLGKTLQSIISITQSKKEGAEGPTLIVCPTSLVYNWKEEFHKFNPELKVIAVDGNPGQRKRLLTEIPKMDVVITSYSLLQKDVDLYKEIPFHYTILDEAQAIKNRGTRNARSVKQLQARHKLILSGTPIENSLEELWSLFDFLMPGLLSTYDRFIEKYVRNIGVPGNKGLELLKKKVSPFILRRMKCDVLEDLPPVTDIVYRCHLSGHQQELYRSYANSAREELSRLVKKEGFDKVQIHILATLTRLKQICCHPAIFAKESAESGDSAKYDMLIELLQTLLEGGHRTVIFSQYTKMLEIMREDLQKLGISFEYLDGSSKNRLGIVKRFNEDPSIAVFLVSLKAGGAGLNLVGADTVIHYDMWWNPAVENQATDRVHRIGQKQSVSSYKLVTMDTIEEKIVELQNRKKELVRQVVTCDEEAISKLTWEEVLELLQT